jgi:diacylglycerol O-acyltransferase / wax synthase
MANSRLTTLDASFLEVESPTAHMHVGWAALFAPPRSNSAPTFQELRDHVAGRMGRAPRYRQKLAKVPLGVNDPVWVDDDDFDVDRHVRPAASSDFSQMIDEVMSAQLDDVHPLWELWIADRLPDGRIGVIGKAHHAMVDGLAAVELASLLLDPTPTPAAPEPQGWEPEPAPGAATLLIEGVRDRAGRLLELWRWPLSFARHPQRLPRLAADGVRSARALADSVRSATPQSGLNEPISPERHLARAHRPLADLKRIKEAFGATINDVVLAVTSGAVKRFFEQRGETPIPLKAMVPVSVRGDDGGGELGNQISFVFVELPCDEPDPIERLIAVKEQVGERKRSGKPEGADQLMRAFQYAPRIVQKALSRLAASPRTFNLVVSNIPGPRQSLYMCGCELEEVYPVVPIAERHALSIGLTTMKKEAFFGIYADRASLPDADLLARCLDDSVEELLALSAMR